MFFALVEISIYSGYCGVAVMKALDVDLPDLRVEKIPIQKMPIAPRFKIAEF